jgi:hypothetical protein
MMDRLKLTALLVLAASVIPAAGQYIPQSAHVNLFFPQLADGGPPQSQWQTTFLFSNPGLSVAHVDVLFYGNDGQPLALDFGNGPVTELDLEIPSRGSRLIRSRVASPTTVVGWALALSDIPVQGTLEFRTIENGVPKLAVNAEATLPSLSSFYPANAFTGIALGNVLPASPASVRVLVRNGEGQTVGESTIDLAGNGHVSFTLLERFPGLGTGFEGTVQLSSTRQRADFVAWALRSDSSGVISSLPSGRLRVPTSHVDEIWLAFLTTLNAARNLDPAFQDPVRLQIGSERETNAFAANGNTVQVNLALAELIADSPSELAVVVAHELGHIYQQRTGKFDFDPNAERDADIWGLFLSLIAGYDPYASAGTLSKLAMATGRAGLTSQFENALSGEAHGSFNDRVSTVYDAIEFMCSPSVAKESCDEIKDVLHPHFPASIPLQRVVDSGRHRPQVVQGPDGEK